MRCFVNKRIFDSENKEKNLFVRLLFIFGINQFENSWKMSVICLNTG